MTFFPKYSIMNEGLFLEDLSYHDKRREKLSVKKDIPRVLGRQLKRLRLEQNLSGVQLGKILNISQQQVSRYEHGATVLSVETITALCLYFNISLEQFLAPLILMLNDEMSVQSKSRRE